jgi:catechol-2,3-dioxygenase
MARKILPERIGHVVIKVRNLERSRKFYTEVLGMDVMMDIPAVRGVFLANNRRDHHEVALLEVVPEAAALQAKQIGLAHTGEIIAVRINTQKTALLLMRCESAIAVPVVSVWDDPPAWASLASATKRT